MNERTLALSSRNLLLRKSNVEISTSAARKLLNDFVRRQTVDERREPKETQVMLHYAVVFLIIALIAGAFGFFGVAGAATQIAQVLFFLFLIMFVASLLLGRRTTPV